MKEYLSKRKIMKHGKKKLAKVLCTIIMYTIKIRKFHGYFHLQKVVNLDGEGLLEWYAIADNALEWKFNFNKRPKSELEMELVMNYWP